MSITVNENNVHTTSNKESQYRSNTVSHLSFFVVLCVLSLIVKTIGPNLNMDIKLDYFICQKLDEFCLDLIENKNNSMMEFFSEKNH